MSDEPMTWSSKDAPTKDPYEHSVLTVMAQAADEDGCNALLSAATIAERAKMSVREVRDNVRELLARGLIGYGDQNAASYIRADRRPIVYDLLIPHAWFGPQPLARINRFRGDRGRPPLLPEPCTGLACAARQDDEVGPRCGHRPAIMDAPPRKVRSDAGKKRARQDGVTDSPPVNGVTDSPGGLPNTHGVNTSSSDQNLSSLVGGGDPTPRGAYNAPNLFLTSLELTSSLPGSAETPALTPSPNREEEGSRTPTTPTRPAALAEAEQILADILGKAGVALASRPVGGKRAVLAARLCLAAEAGWTGPQLIAALGTEPLNNVRSVFAVLVSRVDNLGKPPAAEPPAPQSRLTVRAAYEQRAQAAARCARCDWNGFLESGAPCDHEPDPAPILVPERMLVTSDAG